MRIFGWICAGIAIVMCLWMCSGCANDLTFEQRQALMAMSVGLKAAGNSGPAYTYPMTDYAGLSFLQAQQNLSRMTEQSRANSVYVPQPMIPVYR